MVIDRSIVAENPDSLGSRLNFYFYFLQHSTNSKISRKSSDINVVIHIWIVNVSIHFTGNYTCNTTRLVQSQDTYRFSHLRTENILVKYSHQKSSILVENIPRLELFKNWTAARLIISFFCFGIYLRLKKKKAFRNR